MEKIQNIEKDKHLLDYLPFGVARTDSNFKIISSNCFMKTEFMENEQEVINNFVKDELDDLVIDDKYLEDIELKEYSYKGNKYVFHIYPYDFNMFNGFIFIIYPEKKFEIITNSLGSYKNLKIDLQAIFETSYDVLFVADGDGNALRVSQACESLWGLKREDIIGRNVFELEKEGVFSPSIARLVLEKGEKITSLQKTKLGKRLMVIGTPIKDDNGNIIRIVNASRDISEIDQLQDELDSTNKKMEEYKRELEKLRAEKSEENKIVYRNSQMRNIMSLAKKVAEVNSIILLIGETGVGKKELASFIHNQSLRKKNPYILVNCGSLSENHMREETIETTENFQSGISKRINGLFELASGGTLFLDEINELPLSAQVDLQRILSDKKTTDVRVIVSASKDLYEDVENLRFRKDLFYQLNVIPITIPPLRMRGDDILPLSLKFIQKFNKDYGMNKRFGHGIMGVFMSYEWPGNVTELKNIIERLIVISDKVVIEPEMLPSYMLKSNKFEKGVEVKKIQPLKEAIESLEKDLIALALQKYKTPNKVAEVLKVNQSTVSRKISKYFRIK